MPAAGPKAKGAGRPPRLSLEAIIAAAERVLRSEGPEKLSMRRLASELGSAPMALYYHVRDKDELLLLLMEAQARRIPRPEFPDDPRDRLVAVATTLYELLAERVWIVEVLTGDDFTAPSALWFVDEMIGAAIDNGHTPEQAVYIYRTIWFYIVGDLIIRVNGERRRARTAGSTPENNVIAGVESGTHPHLARVAARWSELNARDTHRQALTAIIDGLLHSTDAPGGR
ncbi:TetR family transcriptional regulator [Spongiactinospora gelatinilytica]|uniref:TetR family transcriptional regulator n=1 Tax=Spongiactinospora gelatinilytica TaxID=2666298 RepID=A0A2W2GFL9_9ACTN|nr:TetR/AcrR family transcriptional regulator C-terminal domain-containing protein [Spongiactinospora gelatinilytica]PZG47351.1 TetR family transcriptional regulator [Spongiactinospora gelatinilytica]